MVPFDIIPGPQKQPVKGALLCLLSYGLVLLPFLGWFYWQLDLRRTLRPFFEKLSRRKIQPSWVEKFYSNRTALVVILLLTVTAYAVFIIHAWQTQSDALCIGIVIGPMFIGQILYHLWINLRHIDKG